MKSAIATTLPAVIAENHFQPLNHPESANPPLYIGIETSGCAIATLKWGDTEGDIFFTQDDMDRLAAGATDLQLDYIYVDCTPYALEEDASGNTMRGKAWLDFTPEACKLILDGFRDALARAKAVKGRFRYLSDTLSPREDWDQLPYSHTIRTSR